MGPSRIQGASMRSWRSEATKVMVFQWPWGTLATSLSPRGAQPRNGSLLVFVHVSSIKTRRAGSILLRRLFHWRRRRATSGRSRSLATTVFFEAELFGVHEIPHRPIVDLKAAQGEFDDQSSQSEGAVSDPPRQEHLMLAADRSRLVAAHLARRYPAGLLKPPHPINHRARRDPKARRRLMPRQPLIQNRGHRAFAKIHRVRLAHPMLASFPASTVNHNDADSGIPSIQPKFIPL